jgi:hypothetical protein
LILLEEAFFEWESFISRYLCKIYFWSGKFYFFDSSPRGIFNGKLTHAFLEWESFILR